MFNALLSLRELVFPQSCLSCFMPDFWLCPNCLISWNDRVKKSFVGQNLLYFKADYSSKTAPVILAAKENYYSNAIELLSDSIAQSIIFSIKDLKLSSEINLITIPSSSKAIRRRGRDHINYLAKQVQINLENQGITANYYPILFQRKNIKDQSNLNSKERIENTKGMFDVKSCENPQGPTFLVDDLVTTGASLFEGARALSEAKISITAAITACAVGRISLIP